MTVSRTILLQLGGNRFTAMTGAKQFVGASDGLHMTLPASMTRRRANRLSITLMGDDTYTVALGKVAQFDYRVLEERSGIYAEDLQRTFTAMTGLDTHL